MTTTLTFAPSRRARIVPAEALPAGAAVESALNPSGRAALHWTLTGRSALRPVLLHLQHTGALPDKNAELLAPRWACRSLYNTLHKACFPTLQDSAAVRGVLVYHQYGFPQRLDRIAQRCRDRGLFLIENNVNCVFDGPPPGGMGEAGLAAIYSFPKMFRTVLGGALVARDPELAAFCRDYFRDNDEPWIGRLSRAARRFAEAFPGRGSQRLQEMTYGVCDYGRNAAPADVALLRADFAAGSVARRKANYALLRREFAGMPFFVNLEPDVIPYVVPLFGPAKFLARLAARLSALGGESGVYHFDAARDVFEPNFVPCVPLPVHQGVDPNHMDLLVGTIRREWSSYDAQ